MRTDDQFGPYRLEALLGRGGMGEVYRAFDTEHDRLVALKLLAGHLADDAEFQQRFQHEARAAARLRNPHIIPIHRFGELDGHLFIDMRFVEGFDVSDLIRTVGPVEPHRAVSILEQAASALTTAHDAGLIHRDVKPSNLLIERSNNSPEDFLYLADFGIAKATSASRSYSLTRSGALLGSLDYMAPEQFDGIADKQTDVYALACVFYELLSGVKPYQGKGMAALMYAHISVPPPAPSDTIPALHPALDDVVLRGMAKAPDERYTSVGALAQAARAALSVADARRDVHLADADGLIAQRDEETARIVQQRDFARGRQGARPRHEIIADPIAADILPSEGPSSQPASTALHKENAPDPALPVPTEELVDSGAQQTEPASDDVIRMLEDEAPQSYDEHESARNPRGQLAHNSVIPNQPAEIRGADLSTCTDSDDTFAHTRGIDDDVTLIDVRSGERPITRGRLPVVGAFGLVLAVIAIVVAATLVPRLSTSDRSAAATGGASTTSTAARTPRASLSALTSVATVNVGLAPQGVALAPDDKTLYVAATGASRIDVVDPAKGLVTRSIGVPGTPRYLAVSRDGARLFVAMYAEDNTGSQVAVVDVKSGQLVTTIPTGNNPYALATAPDGRIYVPNHNSSNVTVIDPQTLAITATITVPMNPHSVAFSPDGRFAYTANHESSQVSVINTTTGRVESNIAVGNAPHTVAVSPNGQDIAVADYGGNTVSVCSSTKRKVTRVYGAGSKPQSLLYSADGKLIYVVDEGANQVTSLDAATGQTRSTTPIGNSPRSIATTSDGGLLFVSNSGSNTVSILKAAT